MINLIKNQIKKFIFFISTIIFKTKFGKIAAERFLNLSINNFKEVKFDGYSFKFITLNWITRFNVDTFKLQEPDTLSWINTFDSKNIFWDIGANIGLYSCYAAKKNDCKVYAFEPSIFNLEILGRNVYLNNLNDKIIIIPIPLTEKNSESSFNFTTTELGGDLATFGQDYTHDGSTLIKSFDYKTIGISIDEAVSLLGIPSPDYIKIDVDGIEYLIIKGGIKTLKKTKSVLIEIDEKFLKQKENISKFLQNCGFKLLARKQSILFKKSKYNSVFNYIWIKK